ncbi:inositol monophosphatase family protein [Amedibacillus sp. YH-ame6]
MQNEILESTILFVKECGEFLRKEYTNQIREKEGCFDLVSDLDEEIERRITTYLSTKYPTHHFLGEEQHREMGEDLWIIDPIDGTTNFISAHQDFAISIAYYHDYLPVFGIVYDVMKDEMFVGVRGEGAYLNGEKLEVIKDKRLSECVVDVSLHTMASVYECYGKHMIALQGNIRGHRSLGCASLSICHIASRALDAYISMHVKCWDYAAAMIVLKEAGGFCEIQGDFFTSSSTGAVFANTDGVCKELVTFLSN